MYKILIVEDDPVISTTLSETLTQWGFIPHCVNDFKNVMHAFCEINPHLVILDIGLPFFSGYHWCSDIRRQSKVPIIFLSSATDHLNIIMAMNMGADDFIAKPFDLNVFIAKVQAMLRRSYSFSGQTAVLEYGGVFLNITEGTLSYQSKTIDLTKNELKMLQLLMENIGEIISRSRIMTTLWESDHFIDDNTLTVNMTRLRRKLDDIGLLDFIHTKKGIGYQVKKYE